ncbi:MAG: methylenetetrahydrofolate--tRNA-(uracil(54)-C(5))-methyltransferase (FADH(2)-oxidizing) TrmFO [Deltaproteobacteria bacterium]|nr:methylenetetrahydrofolate--tRNA-(uracil(54)-C(5))-methyltransferase (FADH(2)-oxidizing) TrmFO [Deltaproteobacteria bacterium]
MPDRVTVVGGGLAGCEVAWQLAEAGIDVGLVEMKPETRTPAQTSDHLAELVCSNSLRSANPTNAVGLLKLEMTRLGSLVMAAATEARVPAGDAFAVDRDLFGRTITARIEAHPRIERRHALVTDLPSAADGITVIATGPLTADRLAQSIVRATGRERLYFYDAIAPVVMADSLDRDQIYAASRYGKGGGADYLNCPLGAEQYDAFYDLLIGALCMPLHPFETPHYFQGCLPIEVIAKSGRDTLRFGTMKPVGLRDPKTGRVPYAVLQLRQEDRHGQAYNLVGFQTKMTHPEQRRVLCTLPGLERAEFLRFGAVHRNTYIDSPALLDAQMRLKTLPHLRFAGQITGVEGYTESAAHGLATGLVLARELCGRPCPPPPPETAIGALWNHVRGALRLPGRAHEPQNVHWGLFPPPPPGTRKKDTKEVRLARAVCALERWAAEHAVPLRPPPAVDRPAVAAEE